MVKIHVFFAVRRVHHMRAQCSCSSGDSVRWPAWLWLPKRAVKNLWSALPKNWCQSIQNDLRPSVAKVVKIHGLTNLGNERIGSQCCPSGSILFSHAYCQLSSHWMQLYCVSKNDKAKKKVIKIGAESPIASPQSTL